MNTPTHIYQHNDSNISIWRRVFDHFLQVQVRFPLAQVLVSTNSCGKCLALQLLIAIAYCLSAVWC